MTLGRSFLVDLNMVTESLFHENSLNTVLEWDATRGTPFKDHSFEISNFNRSISNLCREPLNATNGIRSPKTIIR